MWKRRTLASAGSGVCLALLLVSLLVTSGCVESDASRLARIESLLKQGKLDDALAEAKKAAGIASASEKRRLIAETLTKWADAASVPGKFGIEWKVAKAYLTAAEIDPGEPDIYVGLVRLSQSGVCFREFDALICTVGAKCWANALELNPRIRQEAFARSCAEYLESQSRYYSERGDVNCDGETQYIEAVYLLGLNRT